VGSGPRSCGTRSRADWLLVNCDWGLGSGDEVEAEGVRLLI